MMLKTLLLSLAFFGQLSFCTQLIAVSYFDPCDTPPEKNCPWTPLLAAARSPAGTKIGYAMINVDNGPGTHVDPAVVKEMADATAAGLKMIAYVYTNSGKRDIATVKSDIDKWFSQYPTISGIFLDEVSDNCKNTAYYAQLYSYIRAKKTPAPIVVLNPGTNVPECYLSVGDIIVTFESPLAEYANYQDDSYIFNYPASRFWHIVYNVPLASLASTYAKTQTHHAGYVYITDDSGANPYDTSPSYLTAELNLM